MLENLTNQTITLIVVIIMLLIFYIILNYIYSKYLTSLAQIEAISKGMENLSSETNKLTQISEKLESKVASFVAKSESKEDIRTTGEKSNWESLQNIFPFGSDARVVMSELFRNDPATAKKIFPKVYEKIMEKQNKEQKDLQYIYR